jgi:cupin 2 domain-containing protein
MKPENLFAAIPSPLADELVTTILLAKNVRVERIVSEGQRSPENFWYDQNEHEWVIVLSGRAAVQFEGETDSVELGPGDYLHIAAHRRHRVAWTLPDAQTVWLAVLYKISIASP